MGIITKPNGFTGQSSPQLPWLDSNYDTIYAEFNGNIDNPNIKSNAAIAQSKIANLVSDLATLTTAVAGLVTGTRMVFDQDSAPTGWTRDVTINDRVMNVVSGSRTHGGSWTVSGLSGDSHVLTVAEMPAHDHLVGQDSVVSGGANAQGPGSTATAGSVTGGGGGHTHTVSSDASWRPLRRDMIVASKN